MKKASSCPDFVPLLGVSLPRLTVKDAQKQLCEYLQCEGRAAKVYTPNPQIVLGAHDSPDHASLLARADLLLPDGTGLLLASHLLRTPLPARIAGIDAATYVLSVAETKGLSVALLGARHGVAARAAARLRRRFPHLRICYTHHGYFDRSGKENEAVLASLRVAKPDILFVCFGFPAQEAWIDRHAAEIPSLRLCMGLGGSLDVWAGNVRRAPKFIRICGLEWLWRTAREPRRARIFLDIPRFLALILRQKHANGKAVADQI